MTKINPIPTDTEVNFNIEGTTAKAVQEARSILDFKLKSFTEPKKEVDIMIRGHNELQTLVDNSGIAVAIITVNRIFFIVDHFYIYLPTCFCFWIIELEGENVRFKFIGLEETISLMDFA